MAAVILAGGGSKRFGGPKLQARLGDCAVGLHAARTLARLQLPINIAVCGSGAPDFAAAGFECVALDPPQALLSCSIAQGVTAAAAAGATAVLLALADMPLVPEAHFRALLDGFDGTCLGTAVTGRTMPPALFGQSLFVDLQGLSGDRGAHAILSAAPGIALAPQLAIDIDTERDLAEALRVLELEEARAGNGSSPIL